MERVINVAHILAQGIGMHCDLWVRVPSEHFRSFETDSPVAQRGTFGAHSYDPDVLDCLRCHRSLGTHA
jgi:hypothetical protein